MRRGPLFFLLFVLAAPLGVLGAPKEPTSIHEALGPGSAGPQVVLLQEWLSQIPNLYPEKSVTGEYGPATQRAVLSYQKELGLVGLSSGPGILGPFTRATLNAQFSENQGGIAWVEGEYRDVALWNGKTFAPPPAKRYQTSDAILTQLSAWVYPSVLPGRPTILYTDREGRGLGISGERIFVRVPGMSDVVTDARHLRAGTWQHISVIVTNDNAIFLYNDAPAEAGALTARPPTFFERIAALFSSFLGKSEPSAKPTSPAEKLAKNVSSRPASFIPFVSSSSPTFPTFQPMPTPPVRAKPIAAAPPPPLTQDGGGASTGSTGPTSTIPSAGTDTSSSQSSATTSVIAVVATSSASTTSSSSNTTVVGGGGGGAGTSAPAPQPFGITLLGSPSLTIATGDSYTDPGATAYSPVDGNLTSSIVTTGTVNQYIPGTYAIYYDVTDSEGNEATTVTRTVTVTPPSPLPPEAQQPSYALAPAGQAIALTVDSNADIEPHFVDSTITPLHVYVGDTQTYTVKVKTAAGAEVSTVSATTKLDSHTFTLPLSLVSVDSSGATFSASWVVFDTHNNVYRTTFTATDSEGRSNSITMAWSDPCSGITQGVNSSLTANCSVTGVYGLDGATVTIPAGITLTLNASATWGFNPGTSIILQGDGNIVKGSGASIKKGYLFYANGSPIDTNTMFWFSSTPQTGYTTVATYSQGSYYSESSYYSQSDYCFAPETPILMANGTEKPIRDVRVGDIVVGENERGVRTKNIVTRVFDHDYRATRTREFDMLRVNHDLIVRPEHPIFTARGLVLAGALRVGDVMVGVGGPVPVTSIEPGPSMPRIYNLTTYPDHTYFAGGVLVHNKVLP